MTLTLRIALLALLVTATGAIAFVGYDAHKLLTNANQGITEGRAIMQRVNGPTGPITETDKLLLALKSVTVHGDMVIAHEQKQLTTFDGYGRQVFTDLHGTAQQAQSTLVATAETAQQATATLGTLNDTIGKTQPLLEAGTSIAKHTDVLISDPAIKGLASKFSLLADNANGVMGHVNGIAADAQEVADKETRDFLKPVKWYMVPVKRFGEFWDITSAVARHTP